MTRLEKITIAILMTSAAILLAVGSFFDLDLARAVHSPHHPLAVFLAVVGVVCFDGSFVFFTGALLRKLLLSLKKRSRKIIAIVICTYIAISTSTIGSVALFAESCLAFLFKDPPSTLPEHFFWGLIIFFPLGIVGYFVNGRNTSKEDIRILVAILISIAIAFFFSWGIKSLVMRPRPRVILKDMEGLDFYPWYLFVKPSKELIEKLSLSSDDVSSYFSAHAMQAAMNMIFFPALPAVFKSLKGKEGKLFIAAAVLAVLISFSRIVMGQHFLSDVATGMIVGIILTIAFTRIVYRDRVRI